MTESTTLHWGIDFSSGQSLEDIDRVVYLPTDPIGRDMVATTRGTVYHFNLTSKSPLTSTMSTNTPTDLSGATVSCSINGEQNSPDMATLVLHGTK